MVTQVSTLGDVHAIVDRIRELIDRMPDEPTLARCDWKRHQKPRPMRDASRTGGTQMAPGGIIDRPSAVSASNVMLVCPTCKLPTRIGYRFKEGKGGTVKVRVCKRDGCGQEIDR